MHARIVIVPPVSPNTCAFSLTQALGIKNDVVVKEEVATEEAASEEAVVAEESATEEATIKSAAAEVSAAAEAVAEEAPVAEEAVAEEAAKEVEKPAKTVSNTPDPTVSAPQRSLLALLAFHPYYLSPVLSLSRVPRRSGPTGQWSWTASTPPSRCF